MTSPGERTRAHLRGDACLRACNELLALPLTAAEPDVLACAIDLAVDVTSSAIGYLHYVNDDGTTIELGTWSRGTLEVCTSVYDRHYPISTAGIWADTARTLRPQVHNDYDAVEGRRGLPPGHAQLFRHLGVPVVVDSVARLLLGVGNKLDPYDDEDVVAAAAVAETTWAALSRIREHQRLQHELEMLQERQRVIRLSTWEWQPDTDVVLWDANAARVLHLRGAAPAARGWQWFVDRLAPGSRPSFLRALAATAERGDEIDMSVALTGTDDWTGIVRVQGHVVPRGQGHGYIVLGTVMEVPVHQEAALARHRATHDAETGVRPRSWLLEELERRLARPPVRASDVFGLLVVDVDVEPPERWPSGGALLRECADRLAAFGGDGTLARLDDRALALLRRGPMDATVLTALAEDVAAELSAPVRLEGRELRPVVRVGAVVSDRAPDDVRGLLAAAEDAVVVARRHGRSVVVGGEPLA